VHESRGQRSSSERVLVLGHGLQAHVRSGAGCNGYPCSLEKEANATNDGVQDRQRILNAAQSPKVTADARSKVFSRPGPSTDMCFAERIAQVRFRTHRQVKRWERPPREFRDRHVTPKCVHESMPMYDPDT
jgi:hypothetical protein